MPAPSGDTSYLTVDRKSDISNKKAPRIFGTLTQNFPSFAKDLQKNQIVKIETNKSGRWSTTMRNVTPVKRGKKRRNQVTKSAKSAVIQILDSN